jgi:AcrR family transcriptional regulator
MTQANEAVTGRELQRLATRERVYQAAVDEFERSGVADADISTIVSAAGVSRGTFYFHFPTKEHALAELTRRAEAKIASELAEALSSVGDLATALAEVIRLVVAEEERLGHILFRDVLGLYFSASQPELSDYATHPLVHIVIEQIELARDRGEVYGEVEAEYSAVFFLIGLYGLLITNRDHAVSGMSVLEKYLSSFCRGLWVR